MWDSDHGLKKYGEHHFTSLMGYYQSIIIDNSGGNHAKNYSITVSFVIVIVMIVTEMITEMTYEILQ